MEQLTTTEQALLQTLISKASNEQLVSLEKHVRNRNNELCNIAKLNEIIDKGDIVTCNYDKSTIHYRVRRVKRVWVDIQEVEYPYHSYNAKISSLVRVA